MELENLLFPPLFLWFGKTMWHNHLEWKNTDQKERLKACYMVMQGSNHQLLQRQYRDEVMISMKEENEKEADRFLDMLDLIKVKRPSSNVTFRRSEAAGG